MLASKIKLPLLLFILFYKTTTAQNLTKSLFPAQLEEYNTQKKIELLTKKAGELKEQNISESIIYYKYALELAENNKHLKNALYLAYQLADIFKSSCNYHYALKYYVRYGEIADQLDDDRARGVSNYYQGDMYLIQNDRKKAEYFFLKSCDFFEIQNCYTDLSNVYNSLGVLYSKSNLDKALQVYGKAFKLESKYGSQSKCALILNNIACNHLTIQKLDQAKIKLDSALSLVKSNDTETLSYIYCNYGEYYQMKKKYKLAEEFYLKSIDLKLQLYPFKKIHETYLLLSNLYEETGNYKNALSSFKQYKTIQDSINKLNNIELFHKQEFEQNLKQLEHNNDIEILNQKRKDLLYRILIIASFLFVLVLMSAILYRKKIQYNKIKLSKENKTLKENLLLEKLESKNKELTSKAILLSERNDLIKSVSEKLDSCKSKLKKSNVDIIQEIINDLNSNVNEKQWEDFQQNFNNQHPDFYKNLLHEFPTLSPKELKMCSFLKLNMTSKEIALITHMTINSVEVSRSRLRKKLALSNSNISLFVFLSKY